MTVDISPLSPIRIRFKQDIHFNGRGERTQEAYVRTVRKFSEFLKREPDSASEDDLRNYLLFVKNDRQWAPSQAPSTSRSRVKRNSSRLPALKTGLLSSS